MTRLVSFSLVIWPRTFSIMTLQSTNVDRFVSFHEKGVRVLSDTGMIQGLNFLRHSMLASLFLVDMRLSLWYSCNVSLQQTGELLKYIRVFLGFVFVFSSHLLHPQTYTPFNMSCGKGVRNLFDSSLTSSRVFRGPIHIHMPFLSY
jgi:hypothetical protein